jgi:hypothetical protein
MVRLGPIREEAVSILKMAQVVCEEAGERHAERHVHIATCAIRSVEQPNPRDLLEAADSFDPWTSHEDVHPWLQSVALLCADALRWTHEEEKRREMSALQGFWAVFDADQQTHAPTMKGWLSIAQEFGKWLGYDVRADDGIQLRHSRLSFDPGRKVFVFTWTERKKFLDF